MTDRPESGKMQFGDDWPGVFLRGDNAGPMAMYLSTLLDALDKHPDVLEQIGYSPIYIGTLRGLISTLAGSDVRSGEEPQMLRPWQDCLPPASSLRHVESEMVHSMAAAEHPVIPIPEIDTLTPGHTRRDQNGNTLGILRLRSDIHPAARERFLEQLEALRGNEHPIHIMGKVEPSASDLPTIDYDTGATDEPLSGRYEFESSGKDLDIPPGPPIVGRLKTAFSLRRPHVYPGVVDGRFDRSSRCLNGCGSFMGSSRSRAPEGVDPFGECPESPVQPLQVRSIAAVSALSKALSEVPVYQGIVDAMLHTPPEVMAQRDLLNGGGEPDEDEDYTDRFLDQDGTRPCQRCTHCIGMPHHWNPDAGYAGYRMSEPQHPAALAGFEVWLECKHCRAWRVESAEEEARALSEEPPDGWGQEERRAMEIQRKERES